MCPDGAERDFLAECRGGDPPPAFCCTETRKNRRSTAMRAVVQRVKASSLKVDGKLISEIPFGLVVFFGVRVGDAEGRA